MLSQLQEHLAEIYSVDPGHDVQDFLITDPVIAKALANGSLIRDTDESVLMREEEDGLALSVFLDEEMMQRLQDTNPLQELQASKLADLWTVLEGISHFNYIAWSARKNRQVSLLELEMQAEVDKFVSTLFMALGQDNSSLAKKLHGWLFNDFRFHPDLDDDQLERYSTAHRYAAVFCHGLHDRVAQDSGDSLDELRRFYRLSRHAKISHIHSKVWAQ
jgi:hypothetical protein